MKKLLLASLAITMLTAGSAIAADLSAKAPVYKAPPPARIVAPFSWTGFYIGAHGGADWFNKDWFVPNTTTNVSGGCAIPGCNFSAGGHTASSWLAGGQVGFNYQVGWWVAGVEAQFSWTRLEASNPDVVISNLIDHSKTDWLGTLAGRLGVTWDRVLLYGKGGAAWAHDTFWTTVTSLPGAGQSLTDTRWGWMLGAGAEYAFSQNWSVKVEYDYLDFGRHRETLQPVSSSSASFDYDIRQTIQLVKAGVNYRFDWTSPVAARY